MYHDVLGKSKRNGHSIHGDDLWVTETWPEKPLQARGLHKQGQGWLLSSLVIFKYIIIDNLKYIIIDNFLSDYQHPYST